MVNPESISLASLPSVRFNKLKELPSVSCVYFCLPIDNNPVYIGETENLLYRWTGHPKYLWCEDLRVRNIAWLEVPVDELISRHSRQRKRLKIEKAFVSFYRPILNTQLITSRKLLRNRKEATYTSKHLDAVLFFNGYNPDDYYMTEEGQIFSLDGDTRMNEGEEASCCLHLEVVSKMRPQQVSAFLKTCQELSQQNNI